MAKLKTFEEYIASLDSAEEIEKDTMDMGEPKELGDGEEVVTADQPEAEAPESSDDEGAGVDAEEMEADTEEVYSEEDKETEEGDQDMPEDEGEEGAKEVTEAEDADEDEVETQIADVEGEEIEKSEESDEEEDDDDDDEEEDDDDDDDDDDDESEDEEESEEAEAKSTVEEMVKELYERVKAEAKVWEADMHDTHTIESYLKENAALVAMMAAKTLKESREDITQEAYEAACNGLKEAYAKKIDEMMEAWGSEGEEA